MNIRNNQKGVGAVEALLILVAIAMVGFIGWFVWHSQIKTNSTLNTTNSSNSQATTSTHKLAITEWNVQAQYKGSDTLSYKIVNDTTAQVISKHLADTYGCTALGGGMIQRYSPNDVYSDGQTVLQAATQNSSLFKVGDYYYSFVHDQAACSDTVTVSAQNQANDFVKALVPKLASAN